MNYRVGTVRVAYRCQKLVGAIQVHHFGRVTHLAAHFVVGKAVEIVQCFLVRPHRMAAPLVPAWHPRWQNQTPYYRHRYPHTSLPPTQHEPCPERVLTPRLPGGQQIGKPPRSVAYGNGDAPPTISRSSSVKKKMRTGRLPRTTSAAFCRGTRWLGAMRTLFTNVPLLLPRSSI